MIRDLHASSPRGAVVPQDTQLVEVDPTAPLVREFVIRHLIRGTIRVFRGERGRLFLLPTGLSVDLTARRLQAGG